MKRDKSRAPSWRPAYWDTPTPLDKVSDKVPDKVSDEGGWVVGRARRIPVTLGFIVLVAALALVAPASGQAALDKMIFTVGTTRLQQSTPWAYVVWQANAPDLLKGRAFAIYLKAGDANSSALYTRQSVAVFQTDPNLIQLLLNHSVNLGENLGELESSVQSLFQSLMPPAGALLKDKVSIVLQGGMSNPDHFKNLILLSRLHPAISLCLGFGHAQSLPGPGLFTFEVRAFNVAKEQDLGVVGRVTVNAMDPLILPAPGQPVQVPLDSLHPTYDDLNARFRWATSPELRRLSLLSHGFNLYRMTKALAEQNNYHLNAPTPLQWQSLKQNPPPGLAQVNRAPILLKRNFDTGNGPGAVGDFSVATGDPSTYFTVDDNHRFDPGGSRHVNGDQFYYFVTARDLLGRDGLVSPAGTLTKICDRFPPDAPKGLKVEVAYDYRATLKNSNQVLSVSWLQHTNNANETVVKYHLYRWSSPTEMLQKQAQPLLNRIATVNHVNGATGLSLRDENLPGSPTLAADAGKTFWYTARAEDNGACGGNLSGNSAPAFGVLRDREGPGATTGLVHIRCCRPEAAPERTVSIPRVSPDATIANFEVSVSSPSNDVAYAEVYAFRAFEPSNLVARAFFDGRATVATAEFALVRASIERQPLSLYCVTTHRNGEQSDPAVMEAVPVPAPGNVTTATFTSGRRCERVRLLSNDTNAPGRCIKHYPKPPGANGPNDPIEICFNLTTGTREWKLYRRVDDGPLSLLKQGLADANTTTQVCTNDTDYPIIPADLCYFVQLFDIHGNPSPMILIKCLKLVGKKSKPLLTPLEPTGTSANPQMKIRWFCPSYGVERFLVQLSDGSLNPPQQISLQVSDKQGAAFELIPLDNFPAVRVYGVYKTPMVGPGFGLGGAQFLVTANIAKNVRYTVRIQAIGKDDLPGEYSNVEQMRWSEAPLDAPEVPWPALDLPPVSTIFKALHPGLAPVRLQVEAQYPVGIRIGQAMTVSNANQRPFTLKTHADPLTYLDKGFMGVPLFPVALFRYQVPNNEFPQVSGDLTQVSPLMERIAYQEGNSAQFGPVVFIHDPFIGVYGGGGLVATPADIFLLDTQPMLARARYGYLLARFGVDKEIREVIPVGEVEVTP